MGPTEITRVIDDELQNLEIILRHFADPNNLGDTDGEHVRSFLAESGLRKLDRIQSHFEQLKPT